MKKTLLVLVCAILLALNLNAQNFREVPAPSSQTSLGIGIGLDYGGYGTNMLVYPAKNVGVFGGIGYALIGVGVNAGVKLRIPSKKHYTDPYFLAMYGYNSAIKVKGASQFNKFYYGPSFGFGLDFRTKQSQKGFWTMALIVPVRKSEVDDYMDYLKGLGADFKNGLSPVMLSFGYHFYLN